MPCLVLSPILKHFNLGHSRTIGKNVIGQMVFKQFVSQLFSSVPNRSSPACEKPAFNVSFDVCHTSLQLIYTTIIISLESKSIQIMRRYFYVYIDLDHNNYLYFNFCCITKYFVISGCLVKTSSHSADIMQQHLQKTFYNSAKCVDKYILMAVFW